MNSYFPPLTANLLIFDWPKNTPGTGLSQRKFPMQDAPREKISQNHPTTRRLVASPYFSGGYDSVTGVGCQMASRRRVRQVFSKVFFRRPPAPPETPILPPWPRFEPFFPARGDLRPPPRLAQGGAVWCPLGTPSGRHRRPQTAVFRRFPP